MSDDQTLVKRLREVGGMRHDGATRWYINPDGPEAAERIEKLEAALREIVQEDALTGKTVFVGDFGKIAIAALREKE